MLCVLSCWVVSFSRTSVIFPSILFMLFPLSLFKRAWILSFADWLTSSMGALLISLSSWSSMLFMYSVIVFRFCMLKTLLLKFFIFFGGKGGKCFMHHNTKRHHVWDSLPGLAVGPICLLDILPCVLPTKTRPCCCLSSILLCVIS